MSTKIPHAWLKTTRIIYVPGPSTPLLDEVAREVLQCFARLGHMVQTGADETTDIVLTTARLGEPLGWREALMFTSRQRLKLSRTPTVFTLLHITPARLQDLLLHFEAVLPKEPPDPADYDFPGLGPQAYLTLIEQGQRGGPMLALLRLLQAQAKCLRIVLVVGEDRPQYAYHFDLVGAHPRTAANDLAAFYEDIVLRMVTSVSTHDVTQHEVMGESITHALWDGLSTPAAMQTASHELGKRRFFTEMIRVTNLAHVPAIGDSIKSQYSEGCFATWEPAIPGLIATVTGSARPVEKENITEDDLTVIVGVRPDGQGAYVRQVEGKRNDPPSTEAVEMLELDSLLPTISLNEAQTRVPVARSKLHGHRGVSAYDPRLVEHVFLDAPYYHYPVSCGSDAQARAIKAAFSRSEALQNPDDPRQVVFTVLPGHGTVIVEKWATGKVPFQLIWEYMDAGYLQIDRLIPQGLLEFVPAPDGRKVIRTPESGL